jgi:SAM-dependent methyltransferase
VIEIWHTREEAQAGSQAAYDEIYTGAGICLRDSFYLWLVRLLQPQAGRRLLDVSCGQGTLVRFARQAGLNACGADFSGAAVRRARQLVGTGSFALADGTQLPFPDAAFDYCTCIGSLEHFVDPEGGMREIGRVLRPGGTACVLVPNTFSLFGNVNYARKRGEIFDDGQPIQRYNTRGGWQAMLERSGLRVQAVKKWEIETPYTLPDVLWYLRRPRKVAHLLAGLIVPTNLANSLVYLCGRT